MTKVLIVGGGISGLTVAHELARHSQFDVTVIERNQVLGGKARSIRHPDDNVGEHAMRVYLASYSTLFQTMEEISFGSSNAYENLVYEDFSMRLRGQDVVLSSQYVSFFQHVRDAFRIAQFLRRTGLSIFEIIFFLYKTGRLLRMSDARVAHELAGISFTQYMDPQGRRSQAFRDVIFVFPEVVLAAKRTSSAAVVTRMLLEWFVGPFLRSNYRRLGFASLNGPTSEHFIDPWVAHLQQQGVHFILDKRVTQILHSGPDVTGLETSDGQVLTADL